MFDFLVKIEVVQLTPSRATKDFSGMAFLFTAVKRLLLVGTPGNRSLGR